MATTATRLHLLPLRPHTKLLKTSFLSPLIKFPNIQSSSRSYKLCSFRSLSSNSDQIHEVLSLTQVTLSVLKIRLSFFVEFCVLLVLVNVQNSTKDESNGSIVGDFLDYLNESWTQFHATGEIYNCYSAMYCNQGLAFWDIRFFLAYFRLINAEKFKMLEFEAFGILKIRIVLWTLLHVASEHTFWMPNCSVDELSRSSVYFVLRV